MSNVLNRTTLQYLQSVNTPDYPIGDWVINPDLSGVVGVPQKYWKLTGDVVSEMTQPEKDAVDAAEAAAVLFTSAEAEQIDDFETAGTAYATVLTLAPPNSFAAGDYRVSWSSSVKRQSNRGFINLRVLADSSPVFELQEIDPRRWLHQSGQVRVTWTEDTHTVELQIASTTAGRSVFIKDATLAVNRENPNG